MIISCNNCNKKFNINPSLIPEEGRDLQCGSCNHVWFFKLEAEKSKPLTLNNELKNKEPELNIAESDFKNEVEEIKKTPVKKNEHKIKKDIFKEKPQKTNLKKETKSNKFFSYLVVFIISFVALIILLDTLKKPLINVFPGIEIILFSLFETLKDIKLFIIDLT